MTAKHRSRILNPYKPFQPAIEAFVGRQKILDFFCKRISPQKTEYRSSKNILLLGGAGTGKTSVIAKLLASTKDQEFVKVNLDVGKYIEDINGFIADFLIQLGYTPTTKLSFKKFASSISFGFPAGIQIIPGQIFTNQLPSSVDSQLSEAMAYIINSTQNKGKKFLLVVDQYGRLSEMQGGCHIVRHLTSLVKFCQEHELSSVLVVLALRPERKGVLEFPFGSSIFDETLFEKFGLYPFTNREVRLAISKPCHALPFKFRESTIKSIQQELKSNIPFHVAIACYLVWEGIVSKHTTNKGTLSISVNKVRNLLKGGQELIYGKFTARQQEVLKILAQCHPIPLSIGSLTKRLSTSPQKEVVDDVERVLKLLKDHELRPLQYIERRNGYRISHDLFADYILAQHCHKGSREINALQGILDLTPVLMSDGEFVLNQSLLNRMWSFRDKLQFSTQSLRLIAHSILSLPEENWEVHFQWFSTLGSQFQDTLLSFHIQNLDELRKKGLARAMGLSKNIEYVNRLTELLADMDDDVRITAAESMGAMRHRNAANGLIIGLKDPKADVREACARALGKIGLKQTISELSVALRDESYGVIREASEAIAHIGGTEAFEVLKRASKSRNNELRRIAIQVLPDLKHHNVEQLLIGKLRSKKAEARVWVIRALSKLDDPKVISAIAQRLFDQSPTVALAAARVLAEKANEPSWRALGRALSSPIPAIRFLAVSSLKAAPLPLCLELARVCTSDPWFTKILKASTLGNIGNKDSFDTLRVLLYDQDDRVRSSAIRALASHKQQRILDKLDDALGDSSALVRKTALEVVIRMGKSKLTQRIAALRNDPDPTVSWLAHRVFLRPCCGQHVVENKTTGRNVKKLLSSFEKRLDKIRSEETTLTDQALSYRARRGLSKGPESALASIKPKIVVRAAKLINQTGIIGGGEARDSYDKLIRTLLCSENPEIQTAIIEHILTSEAYDSLYSSISSDKNFKARLAAVNKIGLKESGVEALLKALQDPCWLVRSRAMIRLSGKKNVSLLKRAIAIMRRYRNKDLLSLFWGLEVLYGKQSADWGRIPLVKQEDNPAQWWDLFEDFYHEIHERWKDYAQGIKKFKATTSGKKTNKSKKHCDASH